MARGLGGIEMDPITVIVTALAAGGASGLTDAASTAVKDAYTSLKALVVNQLGAGPDAEFVLARHEEDPERWQAPLMGELADAEADRDPELVGAARTLLRLVDVPSTMAGKYTVDVRGAQGVQIGDHGSQHNVFNAPAGG